MLGSFAVTSTGHLLKKRLELRVGSFMLAVTAISCRILGELTFGTHAPMHVMTGPQGPKKSAGA